MRLPRLSVNILAALFLGCICLSADIHDKREWRLKNGDSVELDFVTAYGHKVYFYDGDDPVNTDIYNLTDEDQADIVLWARKRDQALQEGTLPLGEFSKQFREDAQKLVDGKLKKPDWNDVPEAEFYGIYTSASWCGPCREFTPRLVAGYNTSKQVHGDRFEFILCSWDKTRGAMIDYMSDYGMKWYGNWSSRDDRSWRKYQATGIPCLVIVDRNGYPLSHSYKGNEYLGPGVPLNDLYKLLSATMDRPGGRLSVPTPGIDFAKLTDLIRNQKRQVERSGTDANPSPIIRPVKLLQKLQDPEADLVSLVIKIQLDKMGVVRSTELVSHDNPVLAEALNRALVLWQFMPRITVEEGPVACEVNLPLSLKIKPSLLAARSSAAVDN